LTNSPLFLNFLLQNTENRASPYSILPLDTIEQRLISLSSSSSQSDQISNIIFDDLLRTTSDIFKDQKRFFIKFQNIISRNDLDKVGNIIEQLRQVWLEKNPSLISFQYASSSQQKNVDLIVYPNIIPLEWDEDKYPDIHYDLINEKEYLQDLNSEDIYSELQEALGVDLEKDIKTMLLRFPNNFHQYYIKNSKRHDTFKQLRFNPEKLAEFWQELKIRLEKTKTTITPEDQELINNIIQTHPEDACYTMNYRHGKAGGNDVEADVIMRLRAWGYNYDNRSIK
jgi:hypothetical protein